MFACAPFYFELPSALFVLSTKNVVRLAMGSQLVDSIVDSVAPTAVVVGVAVYGELAVEGSIHSTIVDFVVGM